MSNTKIKICGITNTKDARLVCKLGADYLGLIFADSARRVDIDRARAIRASEPDTMMVGVFIDAPVEDVLETVSATGVNLIQLHGSESPSYCDELLTRTNLPIIKAFAGGKLPDTNVLKEYETTSFFLFDLEKEALDDANLKDRINEMWEAVSRTRRKGFRIFLAGALNVSNVREAVARTNAYCVDVCRGVEMSPGLKDPKALKRFIAEVNR